MSKSKKMHKMLILICKDFHNESRTKNISQYDFLFDIPVVGISLVRI